MICFRTLQMKPRDMASKSRAFGCTVKNRSEQGAASGSQWTGTSNSSKIGPLVGGGMLEQTKNDFCGTTLPPVGGRIMKRGAQNASKNEE